MRLQLTVGCASKLIAMSSHAPLRVTWTRMLASVLVLAIALFFAGNANAQVVTFDTTHSIFYEAPTGSHMFVYTPGVDLAVNPTEWLSVTAGYQADVVSGASVATKAGSAYQATHPGADVVTSASVHDVRNQAHGSFSLTKGSTVYTGGYSYSTEHDYRSNSFFVTAKTDALEHNSEFEIAYARNFDQVCDRVQSADATTSRNVALENSDGCFTSGNALRTAHDIGVDTFQGSWTQSWTPIFATQLVYSAQILDGFQSDPYRSVILGEGVKAQENVPGNRTRQALGARANFYIKPIRSALRIGVRGYDDTWDIKSITADAEFEKYFGEAFRASVLGRFYKQSGAIFFSDDYTGGDPPLGPKGQYFTGDRELSPFSSMLVGVNALYTFRSDKGKLFWIIESAKLGAFATATQFFYDQFTLGGSAIGDARAYLLGVHGGLVF